MNGKDFEVIFNQMIEEEKQTMHSKGKEYTEGNDNEDRLYNFHQIAKEIGITPMQAWYVYFRKHVSSIASFVKSDGDIHSDESIEGRIKDARVYLALFRGLVEETEPEEDGRKDVR